MKDPELISMMMRLEATQSLMVSTRPSVSRRPWPRLSTSFYRAVLKPWDLQSREDKNTFLLSLERRVVRIQGHHLCRHLPLKSFQEWLMPRYRMVTTRRTLERLMVTKITLETKMPLLTYRLLPLLSLTSYSTATMMGLITTKESMKAMIIKRTELDRKVKSRKTTAMQCTFWGANCMTLSSLSMMKTTAYCDQRWAYIDPVLTLTLISEELALN